MLIVLCLLRLAYQGIYIRLSFNNCDLRYHLAKTCISCNKITCYLLSVHCFNVITINSHTIILKQNIDYKLKSTITRFAKYLMKKNSTNFI